MMHSHAQNVAYPISNPPLPGFAEVEPKVHVRRHVRKDSTREEVRFQPWTKTAARRLYQDACRFEEQTKRKGRHGRPVGSGALGAIGLKVLHVLIFKFLDYKTGRLDPFRETIAGAVRKSVRAVDMALARLKGHGVLNWDRRCDQIMRDGQSELHQKSNAFHLQPSSGWLDYRKPPEAPRPEPGTWGDHPPLPPVLEQAEIARKDGFTPQQVNGILRLDPSPLAQELAKLGTAVAARDAAELEARIAASEAHIAELERNPNDTWSMNRAHKIREDMANAKARYYGGSQSFTGLQTLRTKQFPTETDT